jgi:hypothetical protein
MSSLVRIRSSRAARHPPAHPPTANTTTCTPNDCAPFPACTSPARQRRGARTARRYRASRRGGSFGGYTTVSEPAVGFFIGRRQSGTATHPETHQHAPTLKNPAKALWLRSVATVSGALQHTATAALRRSASDAPLHRRVRTPRRRLNRGADERRLLARALGPFAPFAHRVRCAAQIADFCPRTRRMCCAGAPVWCSRGWHRVACFDGAHRRRMILGTHGGIATDLFFYFALAPAAPSG